MFINDEMLNNIVENTNIVFETFLAGKQDMIDDSDKYSFYKKVDLIDIKAFLGLLYLRAHLKLNMFDREIIWHYEMANNFFEAMMSLNCFIFISRFIRAPEQKVGDMIILPACDLSLKVLIKIFPNSIIHQVILLLTKLCTHIMEELDSNSLIIASQPNMGFNIAHFVMLQYLTLLFLALTW